MWIWTQVRGAVPGGLSRACVLRCTAPCVPCCTALCRTALCVPCCFAPCCPLHYPHAQCCTTLLCALRCAVCAVPHCSVCGAPHCTLPCPALHCVRCTAMCCALHRTVCAVLLSTLRAVLHRTVPRCALVAVVHTAHTVHEQQFTLRSSTFAAERPLCPTTLHRTTCAMPHCSELCVFCRTAFCALCRTALCAPCRGLAEGNRIFWFFSILSRKSVSGSRLHGVCVGRSGMSGYAVYALSSHFCYVDGFGDLGDPVVSTLRGVSGDVVTVHAY